jgi:hypothetical protein
MRRALARRGRFTVGKFHLQTCLLQVGEFARDGVLGYNLVV